MSQYEKAIAAGKRSIELVPNGADYHVFLGAILSYAGRPDEAIGHLNKGIRLNPFPFWSTFIALGRCYRLKGQYEKALSEYKKVLQRIPNSILTHIRLASIYALLDRQEEAEAAAQKVLEIKPNFSIERFSKGWRYKNPADLKLLVDALHKAGFPE